MALSTQRYGARRAMVAARWLAAGPRRLQPRLLPSAKWQSRPARASSGLQWSGAPLRGLQTASTGARPATLTAYKGSSPVYLLPLSSPSATPQLVRWMLSFVPAEPVSPDSAAIIGYLPPSQAPPSNVDARSGFEENPDFRRLLHEVLREKVASDPYVETLAKGRGSEGFIHIVDERDPPMPNRTGEPESIVASVLVDQEGDPAYAAPGFYEPNDAYRLVTRDGLMMLPPTLHQVIVEACHVWAELEREHAAELERGPA